jgi:hypothetical protein
VSSAAFYGSTRPSTFADFSPYLSPWADAARIRREGIAVMYATDSPWFNVATKYVEAAPVARRSEVTLARRWLGLESRPKTFVIAIVPPQ